MGFSRKHHGFWVSQPLPPVSHLAGGLRFAQDICAEEASQD